jgi:hypothetical protein
MKSLPACFPFSATILDKPLNVLLFELHTPHMYHVAPEECSAVDAVYIKIRADIAMEHHSEEWCMQYYRTQTNYCLLLVIVFKLVSNRSQASGCGSNRLLLA